ncbi:MULTISPECIES: hypothetical protein [Chitinophagaceae]
MEFGTLAKLVRDSKRIDEIKQLQKDLDDLYYEAIRHCRSIELEHMFNDVHSSIVRRMIDIYEEEIEQYEKDLSIENAADL